MKIIVLIALIMLSACAPEAIMEKNNSTENLATATFAGGCFWCMEPPFENLHGVKDAYAGYTGGHDPNPTYKEVSAGGSGHYEAIEVRYDPHVVTYEELLAVFWKNIDPTDDQGQFADKGDQYKTAIFYHDATQKKIAEKSRDALAASGRYDKPIVTEILPYTEFFMAEEYHQDYYKKNEIHYKLYKKGSGREDYLEEQWGGEKEEYRKPSDAEIRALLNDEQYQVTQHGGTEKPFENAYWNNKEPGLYVDIVTGQPLFSSTDKYDSGTGWPSFTKPLEGVDIETRPDYALFVPRTEVLSAGGTHLGHVFADGPKEAGGERFCINSASLRFIHKNDLEQEGYGEWLYLFE